MKYHVITAVLLLVAIALYIAGLSGAGAVAFLAGVAFETWFWVRIVIKRSSAKTHSSSTNP
jgi:HAMP domain-containing protein